MFICLWTCVLTWLSLEFPCILVLSFSLYLHWTLSEEFFIGKNLFSNIVPTTFHCSCSWFILTSLLFSNSVRFTPTSAGEISIFIFVHIVSIIKLSITSSSVSTIPWTKIQFWWEYYSCLSLSFWDFQLSYSLLIHCLPSSWLFVLFSFFLIFIKFCAYKVNCFIQIFWLHFVFNLAILGTSRDLKQFIHFLSKFFIQLRTVATCSSDFNASSNTFHY